jgi:hypothetical protein
MGVVSTEAKVVKVVKESIASDSENKGARFEEEEGGLDFCRLEDEGATGYIVVHALHAWTSLRPPNGHNLKSDVANCPFSLR